MRVIPISEVMERLSPEDRAKLQARIDREMPTEKRVTRRRPTTNRGIDANMITNSLRRTQRAVSVTRDAVRVANRVKRTSTVSRLERILTQTDAMLRRALEVPTDEQD